MQAFVACSGSIAGGSGNCPSAATGAAASVVANYLVNELTGANRRAIHPADQQRDSNGNVLSNESLADQDTRANLIATLVGSLASALGLNASVAISAAVIETRNNQLAGQRFSGTCGAADQSCRAISTADYVKVASIARVDENGRAYDINGQLINLTFVNGRPVDRAFLDGRASYVAAFQSAFDIALRSLNPNYVSEAQTNSQIASNAAGYAYNSPAVTTSTSLLTRPTEAQIAFIISASNGNNLNEAGVHEVLAFYGGLNQIPITNPNLNYQQNLGNAAYLGNQLARSYVDGRNAFNNLGQNRLILIARYNRDDPSARAEFAALSLRERGQLLLAYNYAVQSGQVPQPVATSTRILAGGNAIVYGFGALATGIGAIVTTPACLTGLGCAGPAVLGTTSYFLGEGAYVEGGVAISGYTQQSPGGFYATRLFNVDANTGELIYFGAQVVTGSAVAGGTRAPPRITLEPLRVNTARGAPLEPLPGPTNFVARDATDVGLLNGRLTGDASRLLPAERSFVNEQLSAGRRVELIPTGTSRSADFLIDGVRFELKTVTNVVNQTSNGLSASISRSILSGRGQSPNIIIDARNQPGVTIEIAQRAASRAYGADSRNGIQNITILTLQGPIQIPRRP